MTRLDLKYLNKKPEKMYICATYAFLELSPVASLGEEGMREVGKEEHLRKEREKNQFKK